MAKIKHYRVPVTVTRGSNGIHLEMHEDKKTLEKEVPATITDGSEVLRLSKKIADENAQESNIAKKILMDSEISAESFITLQVLED